jgi:hypothetical protein
MLHQRGSMIDIQNNLLNPLNNFELSFRWSEATEKSFPNSKTSPGVYPAPAGGVEVTKYIFQMILIVSN